MAFSSKSHFFFFTVLFFTTSLASNIAAQAQDKPPQAFHISVRKDTETLQYSAALQVGTPTTFLDAVLDLGGPFLTLACDKYTSSARHSYSCGSTECKTLANNTHCGSKKTCSVTSLNPFNKNSALTGTLTEDVIEAHSTDGSVTYVNTYSTNLTLSCVASTSLKGLATGTHGVLGLGRLSPQSMSLPTKLTSAYNIIPKFAVCLPSSNEYGFGDLFIGCAITDLSEGINYTPLVYSEREPSVYVKSIKIDKRVVHFNTSLLDIDQNGVGGTKLSTATPYGVLRSEIYKVIVEDFVKRAAERNITRVASVAPFGACFSTKGLHWTKGGPRVPVIDLELPGNMARWNWSVLGANSMVRVNKDVLCLGFVDGGPKAKASIVLGGLQLEDNFLEFDLTRTLLGFTFSLLPKGKRCSHFRNL